MAKIIVLSYFNNDDVEQQHIFVGNEFSRDPADIQQIIKENFRTRSGLDFIEINNDEDNWMVRDEHIVDVRRVLQRNGYTEHKPKRIFV